MAEGDGYLYNNFKEQLMEGIFDLLNDTVKVILVAAHTPNIDTHTVYADVVADEESGTGYTAGGETLGSATVEQDNTLDRGVFDGADVTWTGLDVGTPSHAIMYDDTPTSPTDPLIAYWELATPSNGGDFTLAWHTDGIILIT